MTEDDQQNEDQDSKPPSRRATASRPSFADRSIGWRIRERRITLGLSQNQLAELVGVTYQQLHKYERGINRISAGRLFQIAEALDAPVGLFYEGLREGSEDPEIDGRERLRLELTRHFTQIKNPQFQEALATLARVLAEADGCCKQMNS